MIIAANSGLWGHWVGPILQFVIGLGLVVFIHELGHFLVAKLVGINVERFAFGFGPRLFGIKRGETDYCVNLLPLGGYVKMLGQEDFKPLTETDKPDPRSYEGKTVGQRFAVIAAGVVMNVILAVVLFIIVGLVGIDFLAPKVGGVVPGYPAAEVELDWSPAPVAPASATMPDDPPSPQFGKGIKPGDAIVSINGNQVTSFNDISVESVLASDEQEQFSIVVRRTDESGRAWIGKGDISVKLDTDGKKFVFGIEPASTTIFAEDDEWAGSMPFQPGDRLTSIAGKPIENLWEISKAEENADGTPVTATIDRQGETIELRVQPAIHTNSDVVWLKDGRRAKIVSGKALQGDADYRLRLPDGSELEVNSDELAGGLILEPLDILGMLARLKINAVNTGSRAGKAGIKPEDIIIGYGDHGTPTLQELLDINERVVGKATDMTVLRNDEQLTLKVTPKLRSSPGEGVKRAQIGITNTPDVAHAIVAALRENSTAQRAGVMPGDLIEQVNSKPVSSWAEVICVLRETSGQAISLGIRRASQKLTIDLGTVDESDFSPDDYQARLLRWGYFRPQMVTIRKSNPIEAVVWGAQETFSKMLVSYATLRALIRRTVSTDTLAGPVGIAMIAVKVGRHQPLIDFVYFMAFISAIVAVFNFLPLPVVDGGHAVFLIIEKLRGKPLPAKVMNIIQFVGLGLLLLVFVLLTWQDIARKLAELW